MTRLCECGCGGTPPPSSKTCRRDGYVKGEPIRFMPGHQTAMRNRARRLNWRDRVVESERGCLVWQGCLNSKGYGCIAIGGRGGTRVLTHRFVWEQEHGPIPDDLTIDHRCQEKRCLNTTHMELVTRGENVRRRWRPPGLRKEAA